MTVRVERNGRQVGDLANVVAPSSAFMSVTWCVSPSSLADTVTEKKRAVDFDLAFMPKKRVSGQGWSCFVERDSGCAGCACVLCRARSGEELGTSLSDYLFSLRYVVRRRPLFIPVGSSRPTGEEGVGQLDAALPVVHVVAIRWQCRVE